MAARACDRAVFVSEPLARLCAPLLSGKPAVVIPCAASEDLFFYDPLFARACAGNIGYAEGDRIYVYSGSLVSYQRFDETAFLFQGWRAVDPRAHLLVLTPDADAARRRLAHLDPDAVRVTSARFDTVNGYLNAADAAFMLRRPSLVNQVASPTKFAEYCLAGLPVIMTDAVEEASANLRNIVQPDQARRRVSRMAPRVRSRRGRPPGSGPAGKTASRVTVRSSLCPFRRTRMKRQAALRIPARR